MKSENKTKVINKEIRFFKLDMGWYADVPNHTLAENRMVAGADTLIEGMSNGKEEVKVLVSADVETPEEYIVKMKRIEHDPWGATYLTKIKGKRMPQLAWLCNVTHDVFNGEHPKEIFIHRIVA